MLAGVVASQQKQPTGPIEPGETPIYVGFSKPPDAYNQNNYVIVPPAGIQVGDLMVVALLARGDRAWNVPAGWDVRLNNYLVNTANSSGTRNWIITKTYAGEADFTFNSTTSAAHSAAMAVFRGARFGQMGIHFVLGAAKISGTITPAHPDSLIVAINTRLLFTQATVPTWTPAGGTSLGFAQNGTTGVYGNAFASFVLGSTSPQVIQNTWSTASTNPFLALIELLPA